MNPRLSSDPQDALTRLAIAERRDLRSQVEVLILDSLQRRGLLKGDRDGSELAVVIAAESRHDDIGCGIDTASLSAASRGRDDGLETRVK